jgi:hypothetical protein
MHRIEHKEPSNGKYPQEPLWPWAYGVLSCTRCTLRQKCCYLDKYPYFLHKRAVQWVAWVHRLLCLCSAGTFSSSYHRHTNWLSIMITPSPHHKPTVGIRIIFCKSSKDQLYKCQTFTNFWGRMWITGYIFSKDMAFHILYFISIFYGARKKDF